MNPDVDKREEMAKPRPLWKEKKRVLRERSQTTRVKASTRAQSNRHPSLRVITISPDTLNATTKELDATTRIARTWE